MDSRKLSRPLVEGLVTVAVGAAAGLVQIVPLPPFIRVVVVLPLLGFIPGYAILGALFPAPRSLQTEFKSALAVLLSLCITPALATMLNSTSWGIRPSLMIVGLVVLSVGAEAIRWWREQRIPRHSRTASQDRQPSSAAPARAKGWVRWVGGVLLLALLVTGVYWTLLAPPVAQPFTEFYLEPDVAPLLSQPSGAGVEEAAVIPFTVVNYENRECVYSIEMVVDGVSAGMAGPARVANGERWQGTVSVSRGASADRLVELRLFREGDPAPHRTLHLWLGRAQSQGTGWLVERRPAVL